MKKMQNRMLIAIGVISIIVLFNPNVQLQDEVDIAEAFSQEQNVKAAVDPNVFLSIWDTRRISDGSSASDQVKLPLEFGRVYDFMVSWGDDTNDTITSWDQAAVTHTYSSPGVYTINFTGIINGWRFNNEGDRLKISEIQQWGALRLGNNGSNFYGCKNMRLTTTDTLDLTGTTTLHQTFLGCSSLGSSGNLNAWDVSNVSDMSGMFLEASSFNQSLASWNVSSVTNMNGMFSGASSFNYPLESWNVSNVLDIGDMFSGASLFNQSLESWNVSSVMWMPCVFMYSESFNHPLASWDVSNVVDMAYMFYYAVLFNQSLASWDVSRVTSMWCMFYGASSFNHPLNVWDISNVIYTGYMFYGTSTFNYPLDSWDVSNVQDMSYMFAQASLFNHPLNVWDVSNVLEMRSMFAGASSFNYPLDTWDVSSISDMSNMFKGASSFNQPLVSWDVSNVQDMSYLFNGASSFNQPLNSWDVSNVMDMGYMFTFATSFNQLLSTWDISNVTDMRNMLYGVDLSTVFYDDMLVSWSQLPLQSGVTFHAGNAQFSPGAAETARQWIIDMFGWRISDGGRISVALVLNAIAGPSTSGIITLTWYPVEGATSYRIYRSTSPITDVDGLTAIVTGLFVTTYIDTVLTNGTYYYVVVASNNELDFPLSNCESVVVDIPLDWIAGFQPAWFSLMLLGSFLGLVVYLQPHRN
jgi:surface protein